MGIFLRILSWLYFLYPAKAFIRLRVIDYFLYYHVKKILKEANQNNHYSNSFNLEQLIYKSAFRGTICEYFRSNDFQPNAKDIAIAISISSDSYSNHITSKLDSLIDLSYHLSNKIKEIIILDITLKSIYEELGQSLVMLDKPVDRVDITNALKNKKSLFTEYYKSFNNKNFSYGIKIWHENEDNDWVQWKESESLIIHIDPLAIREGFFLVGFDYSELTSGNSLCFATSKGGYEFFNSFESKNVVWAR